MKRYFENPQKAFAEDEALYEASVKAAADEIIKRQSVKMVFISGPSCVGKTPTKERLAKYLENAGVRTEVISLDDFYRRPEDAIIKEDGTPDFESPESLDLETLHECFSALCNGKSTWLPAFDFINKKRSNTWRKMHLDVHEVCIVEGLHALNPAVCGGYIDADKTFKIYLDADSGLPETPRKLRRLVRDYHKRSASAEVTLSMWEDVEEGSRKYVFPYEKDADAVIRTYINYETYVFRDKAVEILSEVKADSEYYEEAQRILKSVENIPSLSHEAVSKDSFMREFIVW